MNLRKAFSGYYSALKSIQHSALSIQQDTARLCYAGEQGKVMGFMIVAAGSQGIPIGRQEQFHTKDS